MKKDEQYEKILQQAKNDSEVLGLALVGGRGKGFVTENSDYDIYIITSENYLDEAKKKYPSTIKPFKFDIFVHSMASFKEYANFGTSHEWDRYNFAYIKAIFDNTEGEFQKIIDEKGKIPEDRVREITKDNLDSYINCFYRSVKNHRDGNEFASHLDSTESAQWLVAFVFSVEGRVKPFSKYIEWALKEHPLEFLPWSGNEFILVIKKLLQTDNIEFQKEVFQKICKFAIERGYKEIIDSWNGCYFGE